MDGLIGDGYRTGFAHTNGSEPSSNLQWWMVALQNEYDISEISVYGRGGQGMLETLIPLTPSPVYIGALQSAEPPENR